MTDNDTRQRCEVCNGNGQVEIECTTCSGYGVVKAPTDKSKQYLERIENQLTELCEVYEHEIHPELVVSIIETVISDTRRSIFLHLIRKACINGLYPIDVITDSINTAEVSTNE